ncbi:MAG TPA: hypothetical protein DEA55_08820 [Rhodospirillaceae bacterium]|nr:hypothetical protein [Rhodospirillaceae bacterium]
MSRFRTALTVSVALNLFMIGMLGAIMVQGPASHDARSVVDGMDPETQHLMARAFQKGHHDMGAKISKIQDSKKAIKNILSAKEFDADAYDRALERLYEAQEAVRTHRADVIREMAEQLPQEERMVLAEGLSSPFSNDGIRDFIGPRPPEGAPEKAEEKFELVEVPAAEPKEEPGLLAAFLSRKDEGTKEPIDVAVEQDVPEKEEPKVSNAPKKIKAAPVPLPEVKPVTVSMGPLAGKGDAKGVSHATFLKEQPERIKIDVEPAVFDFNFDFIEMSPPRPPANQ